MSDYFQRSLELHAQNRGKLAVASKVPLETTDDLSLAYSPGVARPCEVIAENPAAAFELSIKANTVAVVTDGSAVLGLGNIGALAGLPVMEGKALLFKRYADIDAFPICLATQDTEEIIETVRRIAPGFGGINLEDIAAPRCFEIEERLQDLGIPVFHDDQHGTAIVMLAGLINAARLQGRELSSLRVVVNGAGAAGTAIAHLLQCIGYDPSQCTSVDDVVVCDRQGAIYAGRPGLSEEKARLAEITNRGGRTGSVHEVLEGADVFIGVSSGNLLKAEHVRRMAPDPILFAMANPIPEILPDEARAGGAAVVGTGRSDFPNQINNVLVFPGLFRGALDTRAPWISSYMKAAAAHALADAVKSPTLERVVPAPTDAGIAMRVAAAVAETARRELELV